MRSVRGPATDVHSRQALEHVLAGHHPPLTAHVLPLGPQDWSVRHMRPPSGLAYSYPLPRDVTIHLPHWTATLVPVITRLAAHLRMRPLASRSGAHAERDRVLDVRDHSLPTTRHRSHPSSAPLVF